MALQGLVVVANSLPLAWFNRETQGSNNYLRDGHPRMPKPADPREWAASNTKYGVPVVAVGEAACLHLDFIQRELGIEVPHNDIVLPEPLDPDQHLLIYSPEASAWWTL
jgi:hypothetical protein